VCAVVTACVTIIYAGKTSPERKNVTSSISIGGGGLCVDASDVPTYRPTAKQFDDVVAYVDSITAEAQHYGMCRIIPPPDCRKVRRLIVSSAVSSLHL